MVSCWNFCYFDNDYVRINYICFVNRTPSSQATIQITNVYGNLWWFRCSYMGRGNMLYELYLILTENDHSKCTQRQCNLYYIFIFILRVCTMIFLGNCLWIKVSSILSSEFRPFTECDKLFTGGPILSSYYHSVCYWKTGFRFFCFCVRNWFAVHSFVTISLYLTSINKYGFVYMLFLINYWYTK